MKKLFLLALISLASNSFCMKFDEVDFDKEFTVTGGLEYIGIEGGVWLIKPYNDNIKYAIDDKVANKLNKNKKHKFVLKLEKGVGIAMPSIPVKVISFEEVKEETSNCVIL